MGEFHRARSKIWWFNYLNVEDDTDEAISSASKNSVSRFSWRYRRRTDPSNRRSSSSPSSSSHKSQDSGFSDSESSSPASCSSKESKNCNNLAKCERVDEAESVDKEDTDSASIEITAIPKLPETPVSKIQRLNLKGHEIPEMTESAEENEKNFKANQSKCIISSYLADCYFPITSFVNVNNTPPTSTPVSINKLLSCPYKSLPSSEEQICLHSILNNTGTLRSRYSSLGCNFHETESRTRFVVDELSKNCLGENTNKESQLLGNSFETASSSSDECNGEETVRHVKRKEKLLETEIKINEGAKILRCINVDLLRNLDPNESHLSNLDLNHMPEPRHTSTPKKDEVKPISRLHMKCKKFKNIPTENEQNRFIDAPVSKWLREIKYRYEPECMTTLLAKPVNHGCKRRLVPLISEATTSIQTFEQKTKKIASVFLRVYDLINSCNNGFFKSLLQSLINYVMDFIMNYSQLLPRMEFTEKENLLKLMDMCDRLRQTLSCTANSSSLLNDVCILEKCFSAFVDGVLTQQIMLLTTILESPNSDYTLLKALSDIASLSSNASSTCQLIVRFNGIENLLAICIHSYSSSIRKTALRALSIICNNSNNIRRFEMADGIEIFSQFLCDMTRTESELLEVISVLVQITDPRIEDDRIIKRLFHYFHPVIEALTRLIANTNSCEILLLSTAALANISYADPQAVYILLELNTVSSLLFVVRKLAARTSIFLQDQVATLILNMSVVTETRSYMAQHRAVVALLCFLQVKHSPFQSMAELKAAERLQHKSAIALSRLCTNTEICKQVIELQGLNQLVRLCKEERERNFNDDILVACLDSLRKIAANCGDEFVRNLNTKELAELCRFDSHLLYSFQQESYV